MDFSELLRLLRRTSKRNFDDHGNLRSEEDQLTMDKELGLIFPNRGGVNPGENPPHLGKEMLHTFAPADVQSPADMLPLVQSQSQPQELDMTPLIQSQPQPHPDLQGYALQASVIHAQQQGHNLQQFDSFDFTEDDEFDNLF